MKERLIKIEKNQRKTCKKKICKNNKKQIRRILRLTLNLTWYWTFVRRKISKCGTLERGRHPNHTKYIWTSGDYRSGTKVFNLYNDKIISFICR